MRWSGLTHKRSGGDAVDQQNGAVDAGDARFGAGRQVRAADRPVAIAQADAPGAVLNGLLEHDYLTDVAVAGAMAGERAVHFARARAMLPPEVQGKNRPGKNNKPGHEC